MCGAWLVCFLLTVFDVLPSKSDGYGFSARTDINLNAVTNSPWFHVPYPGTILCFCFFCLFFLPPMQCLKFEVNQTVQNFPTRKFKPSPAQVGKRKKTTTPASIKTLNAVVSAQHQVVLPWTIFSVSNTRIRLWRLHNCSLKSCQHFPGALQAQRHRQPSLWSYINTDIFRHRYM